MALYIVNAAVDNLATGEVIDIDPALWQDFIEAQYLSPIDEEGNRIVSVAPVPDAEVDDE